MRSLRTTRKARVLQRARSALRASSFGLDRPWLSGGADCQAKAWEGEGRAGDRMGAEDVGARGKSRQGRFIACSLRFRVRGRLLLFPRDAFEADEPSVEVRARRTNLRHPDKLDNVRPRGCFSPFVFGEDAD